MLVPLAQMAEDLVSALDRGALGAALDRARALAEALEAVVHEEDGKAVPERPAEARAPDGREE